MLACLFNVRGEGRNGEFESFLPVPPRLDLRAVQWGCPRCRLIFEDKSALGYQSGRITLKCGRMSLNEDRKPLDFECLKIQTRRGNKVKVFETKKVDVVTSEGVDNPWNRCTAMVLS